MMPSYKVSVIIPVYNAADTLSQSVDSVLAQTLGDTELILVNDGSADRSADIINEYSARENVTVIHQENMGVSAARNAGLRRASGEYVCFLDADDLMDSDASERMYALAREHDLDLVACDHSEFNATVYGGNSGSSEAFAALNDEAIGERCADLFPKCVWAKLFRRSLIEEHSMRFAEDMRLGEDLYFTCGFLMHCTRVGKVTGTGLRIRNVNPLSLSKRYVPDMEQSILRQLELWGDLCRRFPGAEQSFLSAGMNMPLNLCAGYFNNFCKQDCTLSAKEKRRQMSCFLRDHRELIKDCCAAGQGNALQRVTRAVIKTGSPRIIGGFFAAKEAMKKRKFRKGREARK